jgi:hypothetical protein
MTDQGERGERGELGEERGGEAACWAHLVCPDCGAMESEGHRPECPASRPRPAPDEPSPPPS